MGWLSRIFGGRESPEDRDPRDIGRGGGPAPKEPFFRAPGSWKMAEVEDALKQHESGIFANSGRLMDALLCDEYIASLVGLRVGALGGCRRLWQDAAEELIADGKGPPGLGAEFASVFSLEEQDQVLYTTLMMGFCLAYDQRESYLEPPRWAAWPAYGVRYDIGRERWMVMDRERGFVDVEPGDGRWALFRLRGARPWLAGYVRPTAPIVVIRQSSIFNWANHAQTYATPSRFLSAPERMLETKDVQKAAAYLKNLVGDSTIVLPNGCKVDLLELKEVTYEIYLKLREALDGSASVLWSGNMGQVKAAGGWGSEHTSRRVSQQLLERDAKVLQEPTWRQIIAPYDNWKRGTRNLLQVPRYVWDVTPPQDKDADAKRAAAQAQADYQTAQTAQLYAKMDLGDGQAVDVKGYLEERGLKVVKRKLPALPPPIPPDAKPAPKPPQQEAA